MLIRPGRRGHGLVAGVQQQEAARAVGDLDHAAARAGLPEERRLLVAGHAGDGHGGAEQRRVRLADDAAAVHDVGQQRARDAEERQELVVPGAGADVVEQRPRRVARVGHVAAAAAEPPGHPAVHGAERQLAGLRALAHAGDVVQQPADLGAREVRVEEEAGLAPDQRLGAGDAQLLAEAGGAPVLPDDRRRDRRRGRPVPQDGGLALVGDADAGDRGGGHAGLLERGPRGGQLGQPELLRVLLDPAGVRRAEADLLLGAREDDAGGVDDERPAARRAGVERQHQLARGRLSHAASVRRLRPRACGRGRRLWPDMIPAAAAALRQPPPTVPTEPGRAHPVHRVKTPYWSPTTHFMDQTGVQ